MYNWQDKKVLIVEDTDVVKFFFEAALRYTKANILWAKTGVEAVEMCKNDESINVILMDLMLPEMDGFTATKEIRKFNNKLPIIAQTAYIKKNVEKNSLDAGCNEFLAKPIQLQTLLNTLDKYLSLGAA
jgi:two-component system, cell cycle response regulator DivK